jgi:hypothetical protein
MVLTFAVIGRSENNQGAAGQERLQIELPGIRIFRQ